MPTQVQIRGAAQATQEARTLASRELDVNTTDSRLSVHDGSTAGGIPHVNYADAQNQEFTYAAATGTDSIAITLSKAPSAYAQGQSFEFKAANTNTGSATINVNSLGAKTIKKVSDGSVVVLEAGDITQNGIYRITYDGTDFILISGGGGSGGGWEQLDTTTGSGSQSLTVPTGYQQLRIYYKTVTENSSGAFNLQFLRSSTAKTLYSSDAASGSGTTTLVLTSASASSTWLTGFVDIINYDELEYTTFHWNFIKYIPSTNGTTNITGNGIVDERNIIDEITVGGSLLDNETELWGFLK